MMNDDVDSWQYCRPVDTAAHAGDRTDEDISAERNYYFTTSIFLFYYFLFLFIYDVFLSTSKRNR